jgi:TIR domain
MSQIFISYSRMDREFVDELIGKVENRGFDVWVDRRSLQPVV